MQALQVCHIYSPESKIPWHQPYDVQEMPTARPACLCPVIPALPWCHSLGHVGPSLITVQYSYYVLASAMLFIWDNNESPRTGLLSGSCSYSGTLTRGEPRGQWTEPPALADKPGCDARVWSLHQVHSGQGYSLGRFCQKMVPFLLHPPLLCEEFWNGFYKLETILIYKVDDISFLRACLLIDESNLKTSLLVSSTIALGNNPWWEGCGTNGKFYHYWAAYPTALIS